MRSEEKREQLSKKNKKVHLVSSTHTGDTHTLNALTNQHTLTEISIEINITTLL